MRAAMGAACLALLVSCGNPPGAPEPTPFEWQVSLAELDDAVLAVCSGGDRLLAVGGSADRAAVYEWSGERWTVPVMPAGAGLLWWCWVDDQGHAYAVGENLTVLRSNKTDAWERETIEAGAAGVDVTLYGIWGHSADDIIAVGGSLAPGGDRGVVLSRGSNGWQRVRDPALPEQILFKAWSDPQGALWVVGTGGTIVARDDDGWRAVASSTSERLISVWGRSADDVYAVGGDGAGLVLRYDGSAWSQFDRPPSPVSGVFTAPGQPLYVAGDRGFVARYRLGPGQRVTANERDVAITLDSVDLHAVSGADGVIVVSGADLLGGQAGGWRGALLTHQGQLAGEVDRQPSFDGGVQDAGPTSDADDTDHTDAAPIDAGPLPGAGQICASPPPNCQPEFECWGLVTSDEFICTERCEDASDCTNAGYGPSPCCAIPGFQTLQTVCIPGNRAECE